MPLTDEQFRKCPHLVVHYRANRYFNGQTGAPDHKPDGWYCDWCDQEFTASQLSVLEAKNLEMALK